jgi:hypothetical protein
MWLPLICCLCVLFFACGKSNPKPIDPKILLLRGAWDQKRWGEDKNGNMILDSNEVQTTFYPRTYYFDTPDKGYYFYQDASFNYHTESIKWSFSNHDSILYIIDSVNPTNNIWYFVDSLGQHDLIFEDVLRYPVNAWEFYTK